MVADKWNRNGQCALVVGATFPEELAQVRAIVGDMPLLVPGIGAQGGDIEATVKSGKTADGAGMMISSSRAILYATPAGGRRFRRRRAPRRARDARRHQPASLDAGVRSDIHTFVGKTLRCRT